MSRKHLIIDTSVFIDDPYVLSKLSSSDHEVNVVLLNEVLSELDSLKHRQRDDRKVAAREAIRNLDDLLGDDPQELMRGRKTVIDGVTLTSWLAYNDLPHVSFPIEGASLSDLSPDQKILYQALRIKEGLGEEVEVVTQDRNMRCQALNMGIRSRSLQRPRETPMYFGRTEFRSERIAKRFEERCYLDENDLGEWVEQLNPNEYVVIHKIGKDEDPRQARSRPPVVGRFDASQGRVIPLWRKREGSKFDIRVRPRNLRQEMAIDALYDPAIRVVHLIGGAGSAKTFLSIDAALRQGDPKIAGVKIPEGGEVERFDRWRKTEKGRAVCERHHLLYSRIGLTRPQVFPREGEEEMGFLPGGLEEKFAPWLRPFVDNARIVMEMYGIRDVEDEEEYLFYGNSLIEKMPVTFMRGRSLNDYFWIIDEAQNVRTFNYRMLVSRVGDGTKLVLAGDPAQTDNHAQFEDTPLYQYNYSRRDLEDTATIVFTPEDIVRGEGFARRYLGDDDTDDLAKYRGPEIIDL